jgi:hypothetical protein
MENLIPHPPPRILLPSPLIGQKHASSSGEWRQQRRHAQLVILCTGVAFQHIATAQLGVKTAT